MPWTFKFSVCLVAVIFGIQSTAPIEKNERKAMDSYFKNMTRELGMQKDSSGRQFQCRWSCQIVESDLVNITQTIVVTEERKLSLAFHYEKILDGDCVNRATRNSNENATEYWQVWSVNNTAFSGIGSNVIKSFSALIQASFEDQVKALCRFRKTNSTGKETLSTPREHLENILRSTVRSLGEDCDAQSDNDVQPCIQISEFNHSAQRKDFILHCLIIAFVNAFVYIGPAVVCLYSATQDTRDGICQVNVEGPSPVGFRSLMGNYFFSTEYTMWHRARKFFMHVFLLPMPFLAPTILVEYLLYQNLLPAQNMLGIRRTVGPFRILCYGCLCLNAFYLHVLRGKPTDNERPCDEVGELPQRVSRHLRIVGSDLRFLFSTICVTFLIPISAVCVTSFPIIVRFFYTPFSLVLVSVVILYGFLSFLMTIIMSYPIAAVLATRGWNVDLFPGGFYVCILFSLLNFLLNFLLSWLPTLCAMVMLKSAAVGTLISFQLAAAFVFSKHNLPFVVCCVAFSYFLWISYRSFTRKYQDIAVKLYEYYDLLADSASNRAFSMTNFWEDIYSRTPDYVHVKRIPKELFDMACNELIPIRKGIHKLVVKTTLSTIFIFVIFSFTMSMNAFLAGTFAMIVNVYLDRRKTCNLNLEQKCREIVREYINSKNIKLKRYTFHQKQRNYMCSAYDQEPWLSSVWDVGMAPAFISYTCWMVFFINWICCAAGPRGCLRDLGYVISNI